MGAHDKDISGKKPLRERERVVGKGRSTSSDIQQRSKKLAKIGFRSMPFPVDPAGMTEIWVAHRL